MSFKPVILWTDSLVYVLVLAIIAFIFWARKKEHLRSSWRQVIRNRLAILSLIILSVYVSVGLLDSIHYQTALPGTGNGAIHYSPKLHSALDALLSPLGQQIEKTYSSPFALHAFVKEVIEKDGQQIRAYPRLKYAGIGVENLTQRNQDIVKRTIIASSYAIITWLLFSIILIYYLSHRWHVNFKQALASIMNHPDVPWRLFFITVLVVMLLSFITMNLSHGYHIFGTDKVGQDVFYQTIKSIRTGLVIGTLTTLIMLPFAILLGLAAGYFGGLTDDVIQYVYTTLSSIPGVLLIAAAILSLQVFIANHPEIFHTLAERADARLLALCIILGVTSWTSLCRMLRGETLKLREVDYIQAGRALGTGRFKILIKHILPNVMHIIVIAIVLDFSALVLAEAVLSYVGVGVDPTAISWGNMINSARLELAREPVVWWPLLAAFVFMFILVLAANLFSDAVRDGFDPRIRKQ